MEKDIGEEDTDVLDSGRGEERLLRILTFKGTREGNGLCARCVRIWGERKIFSMKLRF